jgi:hypothetical protein
MNQIVIAAALLGFTGTAAAADDTLAARLAAAAPTADPNVLHLALDARACALEHGLPASDRLAVIDYSKPSSQRRLWVFDLATGALEFFEWVAHGRNSGDGVAHSFSNRDGSLASSLGLYRTADVFYGKEGIALQLDGLDPGFNDRARERAIVMHGAWYVSEELARATGRIGLSWGCPAVRPAVAKPIIDRLKGGQYLFAYYPDRDWLRSSRTLHCGSASANTAAPPPTVANAAP